MMALAGTRPNRTFECEILPAVIQQQRADRRSWISAPKEHTACDRKAGSPCDRIGGRPAGCQEGLDDLWLSASQSDIELINLFQRSVR